MTFFKGSVAFFSLMVATQCWGYGGSSSGTKRCKKPQFTEFVPPHNSETEPGSAFSFLVAFVNPDSIKVTVRQQPVSVTVTPRKNEYRVSGSLPSDLKKTYARINFTADGPNGCRGTGGWLVKISGSKNP